MIAAIKIAGSEIPLLPLDVMARLTLYEAYVDGRDAPAKRAPLPFVALGMAWDAVRAKDSTIPAPPWKTTLEGCELDVYAYGKRVAESLPFAEIGDLRRQGDLIAADALRSIAPPLEEARGKSEAPLGATSATSSASESPTTPTPSPSSP